MLHVGPGSAANVAAWNHAGRADTSEAVPLSVYGIRLVDLANAFDEFTDAFEDFSNKLLGFPVLECEDMPNIDAGTIPIAFGNFKRHT